MKWRTKELKKTWCCLLIISILCTGCTNSGQTGAAAFFAWMDGYLAMEDGEEFDVALTCFFKSNEIPFDKNDVESLSFDNLDQVVISNYLILPLQADKTLQYRGYIFLLTVKANEVGVFRTDKLVTVINNASVIFPIGNWVFDVQDEVLPIYFNDKIDISDSPITGTGRKFVYNYKIYDSDTKIREIWISENDILSDEEELSNSGEIELSSAMDAPINFIRPRITLSVDGEELTALGMGYYAGAMDMQKNIVEKSKELLMPDMAGGSDSSIWENWGSVLNQYASFGSNTKNSDIYAKGKTAVVLKEDIQQAIDFYILAGMDEAAAKAEAERYMLEREAMYQKAICEGYSVSDQEVYDFLDELKQTINQADNKSEAYAIISQFDSEEAYWDYGFTVYKKNLPIQNYVADLEKQFFRKSSLTRGTQAAEDEWILYFDEFKKNAFSNEGYKIIK